MLREQQVLKYALLVRRERETRAQHDLSRPYTAADAISDTGGTAEIPRRTLPIGVIARGTRRSHGRSGDRNRACQKSHALPFVLATSLMPLKLRGTRAPGLACFLTPNRLRAKSDTAASQQPEGSREEEAIHGTVQRTSTLKALLLWLQRSPLRHFIDPRHRVVGYYRRVHADPLGRPAAQETACRPRTAHSGLL